MLSSEFMLGLARDVEVFIRLHAIVARFVRSVGVRCIGVDV